MGLYERYLLTYPAAERVSCDSWAFEREFVKFGDSVWEFPKIGDPIVVP